MLAVTFFRLHQAHIAVGFVCASIERACYHRAHASDDRAADLHPHWRDEPPAHGVAPEVGALISEVHSGGPGEAAGLKVGDRVLEIDGKPIADFDALRTRIGEFAPNAKIAMVVLRDGKRQTLNVTLAERPDPQSLARLNTPVNPFSNKQQPAPTPAPAPKSGDLYQGKPARLGVEVRESNDGVVIERVVEGGLGHKLGLRAGDVIEQVNGSSIGSIREIVDALEANRSKAEVTVKRGNGRHVAVISVG